MAKNKSSKPAGGKPKKQTSWDQWAALPEYVRERAILDSMGLLGQDVKEYPFLNKGCDIRLTLQQQDLFRRTIGFPFSLSLLKVYLAQKLNIQSPLNYSIFDIIAALTLTESIEQPQTVSGDIIEKEQQPKLSSRSIALILLKQEPRWTDTRIAKEVGVSRTSLYRWPEYEMLRKLLRKQWSLPRGSKDKDGRVEAIAED